MLYPDEEATRKLLSDYYASLDKPAKRDEREIRAGKKRAKQDD